LLTPTRGGRAPDRVVAGVGFFVLFTVFAPLMDMFAKMASAEASAGQIAFARFALQSAVLAPVMALTVGLRLPPRTDWGIHAARGALVALSTLFFFAALAVMPMADTIAIFFIEPLILTLLSGPLLGEQVGWRRLLACAVGLSGALLVIQPSFAAFGWAAAWPVAAAVCFALYLILTRRHALRLDPMSMQFWSGVPAAAVMAAALAVGGPLAVPTLGMNGFGWQTAAQIVAMGAFATVAHLAVSAAFARAPASTLAPFQYLEILTAVAAGWFAFGDFPAGMTWAGLTLIVGSGLVVFHRERTAARGAAAAKTVA
jgi:S-adenosylmethionine uptake transporter